MQLDPVIGLSEPDQEVQELLKASGGLNLGMDYLPGSIGFDPLAYQVGPAEAGRIVWFDALINNVDRSWRNPNMLVWHGDLWLIDHGATMIWHHNWPGAAGLRGQAVQRLRPRPRPLRAGRRLGRRRARAAGHRGAADRGRRRRTGRVAGRRARLRLHRRAAPRLCRGAAAARGAPSTNASALDRARTEAPTSPGPRAGCAEPASTPGRAAAADEEGRRTATGEPTRDVFEYALLRVVPRVERGECFNAGVLVYCRAQSFVAARTHLDEAKLLALDPDADVVGVRAALRAVEGVCRGGEAAGQAAGDDPGRRFRWLIAPRSHRGTARTGAHRTDRRPGRPRSNGCSTCWSAERAGV